MRKLSKKLSLKQVFRQKGVALILMAVILALAASAYAIKLFNISSIQARQDADATTILANAKATLLGYTFGRVGGGERPGNMPYPDRLLTPTETPPFEGVNAPNYDGQADSCTGSGISMNCLGRLPWQTIGMAISNPSQNDPLGVMPWYAVSANLVDTTCFTALNPSILNATTCDGGAPLHPWLTVRDSKGNIISNRVVFVLILPNQPLGNQTRPVLSPLQSSYLADITNYLDTVTVPGTCNTPCVTGTYNNSTGIFTDSSGTATPNNFIMASGISGTNTDQNNQNLASTINDKILFVTIDEFMTELTKRAAGEARSLLNKYYANTIANSPMVKRFPYAAPLGAMLNNNISSGTSNTGSLPIDITDTCTCTATTCTCGFDIVSKVAFKRSSGSWTANTPACSRSGATCTCTGAGSCKRGAQTFSCTAPAGVCTASSAGTSTYTIPILSSGVVDVFSKTGGCNISGSNMICNAAGSFSLGLKEPVWFKTNLWQDYFYYHQSSLPDLQVGTRTGVSALIVGTGGIIGGQTRPSSLVADYLDSTENTNGDKIYDAIGTVRTGIYNDQMFIVAP